MPVADISRCHNGSDIVNQSKKREKYKNLFYYLSVRGVIYVFQTVHGIFDWVKMYESNFLHMTEFLK